MGISFTVFYGSRSKRFFSLMGLNVCSLLWFKIHHAMNGNGKICELSTGTLSIDM